MRVSGAAWGSLSEDLLHSDLIPYRLYHPGYAGSPDLQPVWADQGSFRIPDISEGYSPVSRTWHWKHPVFYSLLFCGDNDYAFIDCGDPSLYITDLDHADVRTVLS